MAEWNPDLFPACGASSRRPTSSSMAGTPSIPRQSRPTGTVRSLANSTCRLSPRGKRSSGAASIQTGVSGPPARRSRAPRRAWIATGEASLRGAAPGSSRPSEAAPTRPSARVGRMRKNRLAMKPMRTIFGVRCPVAAGAVGSGQTGPFFCCERVSPCYKPPPAGIAASRAGVAELVDALDLGSSDESCGGSSPSARTKRSRVCIWDFRGARRSAARS